MNSQQNRFLKINLDNTRLIKLDGVEAISEPFQYRIRCLTQTHPAQLIGTSITCSMGTRPIHGIISTLEITSENTFEAELSPWFLKLDNKKINRVFQHLSAPELFKKICNEEQCRDYTLHLKKSYPSIKYFIQYEESNFHFLSHLLEENKIFYYFEHTKDHHMMHLFDTPPLASEKIKFSTNEFHFAKIELGFLDFDGGFRHGFHFFIAGGSIVGRQFVLMRWVADSEFIKQGRITDSAQFYQCNGEHREGEYR